MNIKNTVKNIFEPAKEKKPFVTAVIVAAGKGERMGGEVNKQLLPIWDVPVIARTLSAFEASHTVNEVVVVCNTENIVVIADIVKEFGFEKVVRIVKGGETRQLSAYEGLKAVNGQTGFIAVHDGARPLITPLDIDRVVAAAFEKNAAAASVRVKDTIKIVDEQGLVVSTPQRSLLRAVQTPQVFEIKAYRSAIEKAISDNEDYTDDCQLLEKAGVNVQLVECDGSNIKITTREDIIIAESIIRARSDVY